MQPFEKLRRSIDSLSQRREWAVLKERVIDRRINAALAPMTANESIWTECCDAVKVGFIDLERAKSILQD